MVVIVGGGTAGITVAARLRRAGLQDITLVDPAHTHHYQPLWTLVGGGRAPLRESARPQASVVPKGVTWVRRAAVGIDPDAKRVHLDDGTELGYDQLVVCPGIQLNWGAVPGMTEALRANASSNYSADLAPRTWELIKRTRRGTAVFAMPSGPIKCAGAPQKIAYLAADYWREQGVLRDIDVHLVLPTPALFGVPEFAEVLAGVVRRYGITTHLSSEVTEVRDGSVVINGETELPYSMAHLVPPQSAPDWIKGGPLAGATGYVEVDKHTLRHVRHPEVFALGDAGSTPNSKTGAAIRKQAPVVVANLLAVRRGQEPTARYDGYASCPLTTARRRMLLAEFDYTMRPTPSIPVINTIRERTDMWYLKRYGLPLMYWNLMLRGRA
ncbi:sulfide:quinone oxidoreductase [Actinokineospora baliensis]|uniref:NAD(P)/FAD-dependent oxidoreductase n=1 Tax=Actinokineospora baliensis TaxID=547056 RepID=UPI00195DF4C3|nr:FAD/NAD(P)-binding oxidoreductase [Actinokineospora baliensis]MBM7776120.1 sulfide:quinone oxidoreductase [Actinokineospora baliensis]